MSHFVYMLRCADGTFYIGSTNNVEKRVTAHNSSKFGAKYTRGRRPVTLLYTEEFQTKGEALSREFALKKLTKNAKLALI